MARFLIWGDCICLCPRNKLVLVKFGDGLTAQSTIFQLCRDGAIVYGVLTITMSS